MPDLAEFNSVSEKPVVLLSPLDWGLGHTVRCIPIVQELLDLGCHVIIACNSTQKALLIREFPSCRFVDLPGYEMRYATTRWRTMTKIIFQIPKILTRINEESRWLNGFVHDYRVDGVISDNRYGLVSKQVPSVFITHQLRIKTGLGRLTERLLQRMNYLRIGRFGACWVPDFAGERSIAGELSNPATLPSIPIQYLGGLSRLESCESSGDKLLIILSGPEPQRSIFEKQILEDLAEVTIETVLVRGLPTAAAGIEAPAHVTVLNHAPASQLNQLVCESEWVISRSGYTTVMDLMKLGKKSILVPTPGQAEQEYLAEHLKKQGWAYTVKQSAFNLRRALEAARQFTYTIRPQAMQDYKAVVQAFVATLTSGNRKTKIPL